MSKPLPLVPASLPMAEALRRSEPLALLRQRLAESEGRFAAVLPCLPASLRAHVRPGPVDAGGWTLLAANAAVAAKLRQLEPRLNGALQQGRWQSSRIRIKVQSADRG